MIINKLKLKLWKKKPPHPSACKSISEVESFANKDCNRVMRAWAKKASQPSPWMDLLPAAPKRTKMQKILHALNFKRYLEELKRTPPEEDEDY